MDASGTNDLQPLEPFAFPICASHFCKEAGLSKWQSRKNNKKMIGVLICTGNI